MCVCVYIYIYVCVHIYVCVCVRVCVYMCVYTHTQIFTWNVVAMLLILKNPLLKCLIFIVCQLHTASDIMGFSPEGS